LRSSYGDFIGWIKDKDEVILGPMAICSDYFLDYFCTHDEVEFILFKTVSNRG
jgi:hypothetical protein